jgi:hypothetical protein
MGEPSKATDRASARAARSSLAALVLLFGLLLPADASTTDDLTAARALYNQGEMRAAARIARGAGGAEGLTLAAKATLVDALYLAAQADRSAMLKHAARDARAAIAIAPDYEPAYLQLAIALGQMAERADPITAHVSGYAEEGKALLKRARALAPDDPWPDGLLGIWHLQLVHRGSAVLAAEFYGASEAEGVRLCRRAARRAPDAIALRYGCAVSMLELDPARHAREALQTLAAITQMPAADAAERLVQRAALRQLDALEPSAANSTR